jgi:ABC-type multidrug transport system ATPase subunit
MAGPVIDARELVKRFGSRVTAVDGLDLCIEEGETYGLLGPNGAGKTTTIRMLLGLVRPSSGLVTVFGLPPGHPAGLRRVGAMGETAFYPFLSGRDNLRATARRSGMSNARVDAVLEEVSMTSRAGDAFAAYSLGMKQRLAVAAALLKDPQLLILDEPSNGLDPIGQLEMQRLIRELGNGGRTIVLSSHDMDEVEQLCGRIGVIGGGRMLAEGSPEELRGAGQLWIRAEPPREAALVAGRLAGVEAGELTDGMLALSMPELGNAQVAAINRQLVEAGLEVSEVRTARRSLRDAFLQLTGGRTGGADSVRGPDSQGSRPAGHRRNSAEDGR